jgi:hypothetical protein
LFDEIVHNSVVEVLTPKMGVTSSSQDLKNAIVDRQKANVEGSTAKIVDDDLGLPAFLIESISNSGGRRLVDNTKNLQTSDCPCIFGGLTLTLVEIWKG